MNANKIVACGVAGLVALTIGLGYRSFSRMWQDDLVIPGSHVTLVKWLSDYHPPLKGTRGDSRVFVIDSGKPGATFSVFGGVHPDEQAAVMAAMILVERVKLESGRLIVIPQVNNSAFTHSFPQEATPQYYSLTTRDGAKRTFRAASRGTNPIDFWPDPEVFTHYWTGQKLSGEEVRNINRNFPGRADGQFTEQVAYAVFKVLIDGRTKLNLDFHEAWPEYPFVNAVGANAEAADLASLAALDLRMNGMEIGVEAVPKKFRGLSYRELGEYLPGAMALLTETPNASQGRIRGITDEKLLIEGQDAFYVKASQLGRTFVKFDESGWPLNRRVARHLTLLDALAKAYTEMHPNSPIVFANMPSYDELAATPVGHFLNSPSAEGGT
jgi:hypothetical protein